nr:uncharacterized protein LOC129277154 [Lytechinus pictus]
MLCERTSSLTQATCGNIEFNHSSRTSSRRRTWSFYNSTSSKTFHSSMEMNQKNNEGVISQRTSCLSCRRSCVLRLYNPAVSLFVLLLISGLAISTTTAEKYIDIDAYIRYNSVSDASLNQLRGAEQVLEFSFRYCHDPGMLIYQEGGNTEAERGLFFALGVNNQRLYLEWKVEADSLVELYIGDGTLEPNVTYSVAIFNLGSAFTGTTFATINNIAAPVNYLTPESQSALDMTRILGVLYIGGYSDITELRVSDSKKLLLKFTIFVWKVDL